MSALQKVVAFGHIDSTPPEAALNLSVTVAAPKSQNQQIIATDVFGNCVRKCRNGGIVGSVEHSKLNDINPVERSRSRAQALLIDFRVRVKSHFRTFNSLLAFLRIPAFLYEACRFQGR